MSNLCNSTHRMFRKARDVDIQDRFSSVNYFGKFVVHTEFVIHGFPPQSRVEEFKSSNVGLRVVKLSRLTQIRFGFRLSNSANVCLGVVTGMFGNVQRLFF
jgi:hypothetical protein